MGVPGPATQRAPQVNWGGVPKVDGEAALAVPSLSPAEQELLLDWEVKFHHVGWRLQRTGRWSVYLAARRMWASPTSCGPGTRCWPIC